jgi:glutamine synthetase
VRAANGKGYIEDRRPASNIDSYVVAAMIFDTTVLAESKA